VDIVAVGYVSSHRRTSTKNLIVWMSSNTKNVHDPSVVVVVTYMRTL
jgi:hypothetical protein